MGTHANEVKGSQKNAEPTGTKMSITASCLSNAVLDSSKTQGFPAEKVHLIQKKIPARKVWCCAHRRAGSRFPDSAGDDADNVCVAGGPAALLHPSGLRQAGRVMEQVFLHPSRRV